jgi:hypothetical protein
MFDISQFGSISTARIEEWGVREGDLVCVRVDGGAAEVRIPPHEWSAILGRYRAGVDASRRRIRWAMILQLPFAVLLLALVLSIAPLKAALYWLDENANFLCLLIVLAMWSGLPLGAIVLHWRTVLRSLDRARLELARFRQHPARNRLPPRKALPTEKLVILTIVPWLIIQAYGTIDPDAYRNTPWTGTELDLVSVVAVAILAGIGFRRWRAVRLAVAEQEPPKTGREVDVLARVRNMTSPPSP